MMIMMRRVECSLHVQSQHNVVNNRLYIVTPITSSTKTKQFTQTYGWMYGLSSIRAHTLTHSLSHTLYVQDDKDNRSE